MSVVSNITLFLLLEPMIRTTGFLGKPRVKSQVLFALRTAASIQSSLSICGGLVPESLWISKSEGAQVLHILNHL